MIPPCPPELEHLDDNQRKTALALRDMIGALHLAQCLVEARDEITFPRIVALAFAAEPRVHAPITSDEQRRLQELSGGFVEDAGVHAHGWLDLGQKALLRVWRAVEKAVCDVNGFGPGIPEGTLHADVLNPESWAVVRDELRRLPQFNFSRINTRLANLYFAYFHVNRPPEPEEPANIDPPAAPAAADIVGRNKAEHTDPPKLSDAISLQGRVTVFITEQAPKMGRLPTLAELRQAFPDQIEPDSTFYRNNPWYTTLRQSVKTMLTPEPTRGHRNRSEDGEVGDVDVEVKAPKFFQGDEDA